MSSKKKRKSSKGATLRDLADMADSAGVELHVDGYQRHNLDTPAGAATTAVDTSFDTWQVVNHPPHYQKVPGIECIQVAENFSFSIGNAIKYLWRADEKGDAVVDLRKAAWYIEREIARRIGWK